MLDETVLTEITSIIGVENVSSGEDVSRYFRSPAEDPELVLVRPGSPEELADVVVLAAEVRVPVFTVRGRYVPGSVLDREGFLIDPSRMDRIIDIDERNMKARIEAGVTFERFQDALRTEGLQTLLPVSAVSDSVLRSYIDRDVCLGSSGLRFSNLSVFKAVLGNGETWASGSLQLGREGRPDFGEDQGPQLSGAFRASEDIFGIPYQATIYVYPVYDERVVLLSGFEERGPALDLLKSASRREHCFQCAAADATYLGALTGGTPGECRKNSGLFSPWNVVISLEHHESLVRLWERMLTEEVSRLGGRVLSGESAALAERALLRPWYRWEYDTLAGDAHVVNYYCYPRSAADFFDAVEEAAGGSGAELGRVVVPVYFGGSFFCETVIYCDAGGWARTRKDALAAYRAVLDGGALVDHPTASLAAVVYERADPVYVEMLKTLKGMWDPKGVLNPDALIKGV